MNTNLDTRAAVNTFLVNFDRERVGDESFYDWIPDGESLQFQGYDVNGLPRSLSGRLTDAHQVLGGNASAFAQQHRQLLMYSKCCALLPRLRTWNNKTSIWDSMVVT